jgi:putative ABC transport system permease protein
MRPSTLVFRNVTRRRSRFAFTLLGITVGIASLVTLLSLGTGLEKEVRKQADVLGAHLVVTPKGWCAYEQISVSRGSRPFPISHSGRHSETSPFPSWASFPGR